MYPGYNLLLDLPITYKYSSIYWMHSSILWLAFCLFNGVFWTKGFNFNEVQLSILCFMEYTFLWLRNIWMFKVFRAYFLLYIVLEVLYFAFTSVTQLGLILVYDRIKPVFPIRCSIILALFLWGRLYLKKKLFILY